jgi:hypothetical protein
MPVHLRLGDQSLSQQYFYMTVIARALQHLGLPQLIHAAIPHVRPVGRRILNQADRAGGARSSQEAERVEDRMRNLPKSLQQSGERGLGGASSLGVPAHAVDHREKYRLVGGGHRHPVLILLAVPDQAHVRDLDLQ